MEPWVKWDRWGVRVECLTAYQTASQYYLISLGDWLFWDGSDWSISRRVSQRELRTIGPILKCGVCLQWSLGCSEHWFCGYCRACEARDEGDNPDASV